MVTAQEYPLGVIGYYYNAMAVNYFKIGVRLPGHGLDALAEP